MLHSHEVQHNTKSRWAWHTEWEWCM